MIRTEYKEKFIIRHGRKYDPCKGHYDDHELEIVDYKDQEVAIQLDFTKSEMNICIGLMHEKEEATYDTEGILSIAKEHEFTAAQIRLLKLFMESNGLVSQIHSRDYTDDYNLEVYFSKSECAYLWKQYMFLIPTE